MYCIYGDDSLVSLFLGQVFGFAVLLIQVLLSVMCHHFVEIYGMPGWYVVRRADLESPVYFVSRVHTENIPKMIYALLQVRRAADGKEVST